MKSKWLKIIIIIWHAAFYTLCWSAIKIPQIRPEMSGHIVTHKEILDLSLSQLQSTKSNLAFWW